ncbi:MAG: TAXI family TRAP transporter solute-binding subunit [Hyphomicrobiaceae bacterium]
MPSAFAVPLRQSLTLAALLTAAVLPMARAQAEDVKLPQTMTFTAYDTGTSGFNITVAVGKALKEKYGTDVRVLPAGNDVARLAPVKAKRAQVSAMGMGIYFAQEAVLEFAVKEWGPQPLQVLLSSIDCNGGNLGIAADTGAKELKDLKGKRVGFVVGSPALNQNALAMLAFAGLTKDDVKIVEFASYGAMWKGLVNNDVDAAFGSTITGPAKEAETSPRGLVWPSLPFDDKAGWERVKKISPFFFQHTVTCGAAGLSPKTPKQMGNFPYPVYMVYAGTPEAEAYAVTKAMIASYDAYKDGAPGASGLDVKLQTTQWSVPFHPGAAKALKEAGKWSDADEAHNQGLIKRQKLLADAWEAFLKTSPPADKDAFRTAWMGARKAALEKAGMPVVFE